jgi:hypothetical protein
VRETTELLIRRIQGVKNVDNLFGKLYDDTVAHLTLLQDEVDRLTQQNEQLLKSLEDKC